MARDYLTAVLCGLFCFAGELPGGPHLRVPALHRDHPGQLHHPPALLPHHQLRGLLPGFRDPLHTDEVLKNKMAAPVKRIIFVVFVPRWSF